VPRRELEAAAARVEVVAQVHSMLHVAAGTRRIQFDRYLQSVCATLKASSRIDDVRRTLELEADPVELPADMAVPLALVVNELVTNAFEHAFPGGRPGTIWIQLARRRDGLCRLTIADDGCGLSKPLDLSGRIGLGFQMVAILTEQIGAKLTIDRKAGLCFNLTLPVSSSGIAT
jgi:two-component system, chemotaxis family, sensor kinase Cph1